MSEIIIKDITTKAEMLKNYDVLVQAYTDLEPETYADMLDEMLPHNYGQVGAYIGDKCIGVSGYWIHTKIWSGKCLEMDNVVVSTNYRSQGIGARMEVYLLEKAKQNGCVMMALDAYVDNFKVHKFYVNQGYHARGYHFIKHLK